MTIYQKFRKLKIDHSVIELGLYGTEEKYFCTPKGARIIGTAGVDGIHYCFVRGQEEMVFAVSPMNTPGRNVLPIARTFEDLLRLLLACGSMAAIEQAHQWDEEQFEEYTAENQPTAEALAVFDVLKEKLGITSIEEPFTYLRRLQDSYNYGELNFSKEYYEIFNAHPVDETPSEWKVTLDGGFQPERGKTGKEITLGKQFVWGDELWHVPAVYLFSGVLVIDFCIQINTERVKAFFHKYKQLEEQGVQLSEEDELKIRSESPTEIDFRPKLTVNGEALRNSGGQGQTWISPDIIGDDSWEDRYGRWILEHYELDLSKVWIIRRCSFVWESRRKTEVKSLVLRLERDKTDIPGIRFLTPAVGEAVKPHVICSSLHFEPIQEPIEWRMIFREKMLDDMDVKLI